MIYPRTALRYFSVYYYYTPFFYNSYLSQTILLFEKQLYLRDLCQIVSLIFYHFTEVIYTSATKNMFLEFFLEIMYDNGNSKSFLYLYFEIKVNLRSFVHSKVKFEVNPSIISKVMKKM